jgi:hypothetical protein
MPTAFGVGWLVVNVRALVRGRQSTNWPVTRGRITAFDAPKSPWRYGPGFGNNKARVSYSYEVQGVPHRGTRVSFGPELDPDINGRRAWRYAVGSEVEVFYNPDRPLQGVLEPGVRREVYVQISLALTFIGLGLLLFWGVFAPDSF